MTPAPDPNTPIPKPTTHIPDIAATALTAAQQLPTASFSMTASVPPHTTDFKLMIQFDGRTNRPSLCDVTLHRGVEGRSLGSKFDEKAAVDVKMQIMMEKETEEEKKKKKVEREKEKKRLERGEGEATDFIGPDRFPVTSAPAEADGAASKEAGAGAQEGEDKKEDGALAGNDP